jgi:hypothetical protein
MIPLNLFPRLNAHNHRVTSPACIDYNCIAWSVGDTEHWWQPGVSWPNVAEPGEADLGALEEAFKTLGYESCADARLEPGYEKVVLYGANLFYTHAARQLSDGKWTSKLGEAEDIEHNSPEDVSAGIYGDVMKYMKRRIQPG